MADKITNNHTSVLFVHSSVDNFGLTSAQFRVLCHVSRREDCFGTIPNIANTCRLNKDTVKTTLKFLTEHGIISKEKRPGTTNVYRVNPFPDWKPLIETRG